MSTYWHVRCATCDAQSEGHINHGHEVLEDLIAALPLLVPLARDARSPLRFEFLDYSWTEGDIIWFAVEHAEHELTVFSEYGETLTEARIRWATHEAAKKKEAAHAP